MAKKNTPDETKTIEAKENLLSEGTTPPLSMTEALSPGVVKLFIRDIQDKSERIKLLETKLDETRGKNTELERKVAVLETEDKYKTLREITIALAGISGGGVIAFWQQAVIAAILGIVTIVLFLTYIFIKIKK